MTQIEYTIPQGWQSYNISLILRKELGFSAIRLRALKQIPGSVLLDGAAVPFYQTPDGGHTLTLRLPPDPPSQIVPTPGCVDIRYEDAHFLVVNKPAGVPVHPGPGHHEDSLGNYLAFRDKALGESRTFRPINRLDRGTSGLMCVAKHAYAADRLNQALSAQTWHKSYLAICEGIPAPLEGMISAPIGRKEDSILARTVRSDGKPAVTRYQVLRGKNGRSLVQLWPETGRTHQIRVHMAHIGHPLVGDFLYGTEDQALIHRTALHACFLQFPHPITGAPCAFSQPLPLDMASLVD